MTIRKRLILVSLLPTVLVLVLGLAILAIAENPWVHGLALLLMLLVLVVGAGSLWIARDVSQALAHLQGEIETLGTDDAPDDADDKRGDEAGQFGRALREMRHRLRQVSVSRDELQHEVDERRRTEQQLRDAQRFLDSIIDNIPHMIFLKEARELRFVRLNKAGEELLGYDREELLGRNDYDLFPDNEAAFFHAKDREVLDRNELTDIPEELIHTRGRGPRILHTMKVPLLDERGEPAFLLGISEDITERKETEQRFRTLTDTATDAIVLADAQGRITYINPAAERMFGYDADEAVNQPLTILMPERFHDAHWHGFNRYLATRQPRLIGRTVEVVGRNRNGQEFPVEISLAVHGEDREPAFTGILRDITERKQAEARLQETAAALRRSNQELEQFAYIASHDLQEPLRKVEGFGQMLQEQIDDALDDESRDYLGRMFAAVQRMRDLINGLLTYSRVTTKSKPFEPVDLNEVAQEVLADLELRIRESGGRVRVQPLPTLVADRLQMRQLLQNLISNGLKFRRQDEPPDVHVYAEWVAPEPGSPEADGDSRLCRLVVQDNGIGIEPQYVQQLFVPFRRLHGRSSRYPGTGIGLAVCRKIAERHGGDIRIESTPGQGSTFIVTLPAQPSEQPQHGARSP